jgi:hypothetical protein
MKPTTSDLIEIRIKALEKEFDNPQLTIKERTAVEMELGIAYKQLNQSTDYLESKYGKQIKGGTRSSVLNLHSA